MSFEQRQKSRQRVRLDSGEEAGLSLLHGTMLRAGDRLRCEEGRMVEVRAMAEPVTTAYSDDPHLPARAAYHLGNRHIALEIGTGWVRAIGWIMYWTGWSLPSGYERSGKNNPSSRRPARITAAEIAIPGSPVTRRMNTANARLRLWQLISPALPIGAYVYSRGLEYAVSAGWVRNEINAAAWIEGQLTHVFESLDVPVFA